MNTTTDTTAIADAAAARVYITKSSAGHYRATLRTTTGQGVTGNAWSTKEQARHEVPALRTELAAFLAERAARIARAQG